MKITFTSGSPNNFDEFQFFNIQISSNDNSAINLETGQPTGGNGVDAFGQGIYGFAGISGKEASRYAGSNGCIYVCSVDIGRFANDVPAEEINYSDWSDIIETTKSNIHKFCGFNYNEIVNEAYCLNYEDKDEVQSFLEKHDEWLSDLDLDDVLANDDFEENIVNCLDMTSPTSKIEEDLAYFRLDEQIESNSIWGMHLKLSRMFSDESSSGVKYYNRCYYDAFKEVIGHNPDFVAGKLEAICEDDIDVIVCFDLDEIEIVKKIDLSKRKDIDNDKAVLDR